jgi:hypothetical protein
LFVVVLSGFLLKAIRNAAVDPTGVPHSASFVGLALAQSISAPDTVYGRVHEPLWLFHVWVSCAFIANAPLKRLIHSCATPIGRLMNSQKGLLAAKKTGFIERLAGPRKWRLRLRKFGIVDGTYPPTLILLANASPYPTNNGFHMALVRKVFLH